MRVLVTGAGGFIGSAVIRALHSTPGIVPVPVHHTPNPSNPHRTMELRDPSTLHHVRDADVVVHAAHAISGELDHLQQTNVQGTRNLQAACSASGVRVVSVSTASVHGPGPWRGDDIQTMRCAPRSDVSRTRAEADRIVLAHGGTVVRPHLVHGPTDTRFVPRARDIVSRIGWLRGRETLHSSVHVDRLANRIVDFALRPDPAAVRLVTDAPRTMRQILAPYLDDSVHSQIAPSLSAADALAHPEGTDDPRWAHDIDLLASDHHLTDSRAGQPRPDNPARYEHINVPGDVTPALA